MGALDVLSFALPLGLATELTIGGRIFLTELIVLCAAIVVVAQWPKLSGDRNVRLVFWLTMVWLGAQVATDLLRHAAFEDWSRGWARIVFFGLNFLTIVLLVDGQERRFVLMTLGVVGSYVIRFFINPPPLAGVFEWWKLFWVLPAGLLLALAVCWCRRIFWQSTVLIGAILLNWVLYGRAMGGLFFITFVLVLVRFWLLRNQNAQLVLSCRVRFMVLAVMACFALVILPSYSSLSLRGAFGDLERERTLRQVQAGQQYLGGGIVGHTLGLLVGGRNEMIVSSRAILDSPIIGHGSWAKNVEYIDLFAALGGMDIDTYRLQAAYLFEAGLIPTHSHILGAWVEAGLGGAIFWGAAMWLFYRAMLGALAIRSPLAPFFLSVAVLQLWDIVFSPFGAERRFTEALFFAIACHVLRSVRPDRRQPFSR